MPAVLWNFSVQADRISASELQLTLPNKWGDDVQGVRFQALQDSNLTPRVMRSHLSTSAQVSSCQFICLLPAKDNSDVLHQFRNKSAQLQAFQGMNGGEHDMKI